MNFPPPVLLGPGGDFRTSWPTLPEGIHAAQAAAADELRALLACLALVRCCQWDVGSNVSLPADTEQLLDLDRELVDEVRELLGGELGRDHFQLTPECQVRLDTETDLDEERHTDVVFLWRGAEIPNPKAQSPNSDSVPPCLRGEPA